MHITVFIMGWAFQDGTDIWQLYCINSFREDLVFLKRTGICVVDLGDHSVLPWDGSVCRVVVLLQVVSLLSGCLWAEVASGVDVETGQGATLFPCALTDVVVPAFTVCHLLQLGAVSHPHEVVEADAGCDDSCDCIRLQPDLPQQNLPSVGQDTKGILHYSSCPAESVVEDPHLSSARSWWRRHRHQRWSTVLLYNHQKVFLASDDRCHRSPSSPAVRIRWRSAHHQPDHWCQHPPRWNCSRHRPGPVALWSWSACSSSTSSHLGEDTSLPHACRLMPPCSSASCQSDQQFSSRHLVSQGTRSPPPHTPPLWLCMCLSRSRRWCCGAPGIHTSRNGNCHRWQGTSGWWTASGLDQGLLASWCPASPVVGQLVPSTRQTFQVEFSWSSWSRQHHFFGVQVSVGDRNQTGVCPVSTLWPMLFLFSASFSLSFSFLLLEEWLHHWWHLLLLLGAGSPAMALSMTKGVWRWSIGPCTTETLNRMKDFVEIPGCYT